MSRRFPIACLLLAILSTSAAAQRRRYYTPLSSPIASAFQNPSAADLARTLTGGPLPKSSPVSARRQPLPDSVGAPRRTCPIPILVPDSTGLERAFSQRLDSASRTRMPILKPPCTNPLKR